MNEAQTWATIGVLSAALIGTITLTTTLIMRTINAQIGGMRVEMNSKFEIINIRLDGLEKRMDGLEKRMGGLEKRMDGLDRDVQIISERVFRGDK